MNQTLGANEKIKVFVASDHAGFELKNDLVMRLKSFGGFDVETHDLGPESADRVDYPDFAAKTVAAVLNPEPKSRTFGLLICGSGQGMAMSANRHKGIRAALAWNEESAKLARAHNNANVLCLGARLIPADLAWRILLAFLKEEFEGGRHIGRLEKF